MEKELLFDPNELFQIYTAVKLAVDDNLQHLDELPARSPQRGEIIAQNVTFNGILRKLKPALRLEGLDPDAIFPRRHR